MRLQIFKDNSKELTEFIGNFSKIEPDEVFAIVSKRLDPSVQPDMFLINMLHTLNNTNRNDNYSLYYLTNSV